MLPLFVLSPSREVYLQLSVCLQSKVSTVDISDKVILDFSTQRLLVCTSRMETSGALLSRSRQLTI